MRTKINEVKNPDKPTEDMDWDSIIPLAPEPKKPLTKRQRLEARKASKRKYEQSEKGRASTKRSNDKYRQKLKQRLERLKELENTI